MTTTETTAPIKMSVTVPLSPADAFDLFTSRMEAWWPTQTHSIAEDKVTGVVFEGRVGGEVYETTADGGRNHWARVIAWDPPRSFTVDWKPNPEREAPTELQVSFEAADGGALVSIEHRAWERLGDAGPQARGEYANGWVMVLGRFEKAAS